VVQCRNGYGHSCPAGKERVSVALIPSDEIAISPHTKAAKLTRSTSISDVPVHVKVCEGGRRLVSYTVAKTGVYSVSVFVDRIEIEGSPFFVPVAPSQVDVGAITCKQTASEIVGDLVAGRRAAFQFWSAGSFPLLPCVACIRQRREREGERESL
jgi:Filamin/ABP280 repeat